MFLTKAYLDCWVHSSEDAQKVAFALGVPKEGLWEYKNAGDLIYYIKRKNFVPEDDLVLHNKLEHSILEKIARALNTPILL